VRSCRLNAWRVAHLSGNCGGDAIHLRQGSAWCALDANQHIAILQRRQHRSAGRQHANQDRRYGQDTDAEGHPAGPADRRHGQAFGTTAHPAIERTRPQVLPTVAKQ
jgi:hypothetical protein